jgi:hypothetical protein
MGVPTREARLAHARVHCPLWNEGRKDEWVASWRTIVPGAVRMLDPVGTKEKHGFEHATTEAYDMFQPHLKMHMVAVHVNGDEMAWVIENHFTMNGETFKTHSIETFAWDSVGDLLIKTYYSMPADVGEGDDPYEFLLGKDNVISND